jgi:prepilin-type N-terminal cleavage/methylation domain-containing protein
MRRAFTLIELLLAVALFAIIAGAAYGAVVATVKGGQRAAEQVSDRLELDGLVELIRRDLSSAMQKPLAGAEPLVGVSSGSGGLARLTFFSSRDLGAPGEAGGRFLRITYFMASGEDGAWGLYRRAETMDRLLPPERLVDPEGGNPQPVRLAPVQRMAVEYRDEKEWLSKWTGEDRTPRAIRARIELPAGASCRPRGRQAVMVLPRR